MSTIPDQPQWQWSSLKEALPTNARLTPTFLREHFWLEVRANEAQNASCSREDDQKKKQDLWEFATEIGFETDQLLCIHRWKIWWAIPRVLSGDAHEAAVPAETHLLLGKLRDNNQYLLMLAAADQHMSFSLEGANSAANDKDATSTAAAEPSQKQQRRRIIIHGHENSPLGFDSSARCSNRLNSEHVFKKALLVSTAPLGELYQLLPQAFTLMKQHLQCQLPSATIDDSSLHSASLKVQLQQSADRFHVQRGPGPSFVDHFGWCTWDSFYTDLSVQRLLDGLRSFESTNVQPRFLILDDGWQHTNVNDRRNGEQWGGRLTSFNANFKFADTYTPLPADPYSHDPDRLMPGTDDCAGSTLAKRKRRVAEDDDAGAAVVVAGDAAVGGEASTANAEDDCDFHLESEHSLLRAVRELKAQLGVRQLLVWHAFSGYWGGVQPKDCSDSGPGTVTTTVTAAAAAGTPRIPVKRRVNESSVRSTDAAAVAVATTEGASLLQEDYGTAITYPDFTAPLHRMARSGVLRSEPFTLRGVGLVHPQRARAFFDSYHRTLSRFGVDGVKVDVQSVVPLLRHEDASSWEVTTAYHAGLQESVGKYFGRAIATALPGEKCVLQPHSANEDAVDTSAERSGASGADEFPIIHCMCHSQGTLLSILALYPSPPSTVVDHSSNGSSSYSSNGGRRVSIVRGSDDFYPTEPFSHGPHIFVNALNSLLMSYIGLHDWDMFQSGSGDPQCALLHAAARAISGGPVYVSDRPTEHSSSVLQKLSFPRGGVPRCIRNARPAEASLFRDPQREAGVPLLLQNINAAGALVVAAFNLFGSVLENDVHYWRAVTFDEVRWGADCTESDLATFRARYETLTTANIAATAAAAWFNDPIFSDALAVNAAIGPQLVEEVQQELQALSAMPDYCSNTAADGSSGAQCVSRSEYIAFRCSDEALIEVNCSSSSGSSVSVTLPKPHDFDIVTFAPKHFWVPCSSSIISNNGGCCSTVQPRCWMAALGATSMFNPAGAVLSVRMEPAIAATEKASSTDSRLHYEAHVQLLGDSGQFQFVVPAATMMLGAAHGAVPVALLSSHSDPVTNLHQTADSTIAATIAGVRDLKDCGYAAVVTSEVVVNVPMAGAVGTNSSSAMRVITVSINKLVASTTDPTVDAGNRKAVDELDVQSHWLRLSFQII